MHPYQDLCHLLYEYKQVADAMDDANALKVAMQIREVAKQLVIDAAKNVQFSVDPNQLKLDL